MRKIILVKGPPGSGKSSLIKSLGWEHYALSKDTLRLLHRAPEMTPAGTMAISQEQADRIHRQWITLADEKMKRGEFVVMESIFEEAQLPSEIQSLIDQHRYDVLCVDLSNQPLDTIVQQNRQRDPIRHVPQYVVEKIAKKVAEQPAWDVPTIQWSADGRHLDQIKAWARVGVVNVDGYERVVHIGDLQGCFSVLIDPQGPCPDGKLDDKTLYVFVGDLLDRGPENGQVMRWFVDHALHAPNVVLMWGNHEDHIHRYAKGLPAVSDEFANATLPQLQAAGITPDDADKVCAKAKDIMLYTHHGHHVMVCHAGLATVPDHPELISSYQYSHGTGNWSDPIDEQFERHAPKPWTQVHGHRNHGWKEINPTPRTFNLEEQVEFGGRLRWAILTKEGWSVHSLRNKIYHPNKPSEHKSQRTSSLTWQDPDNGLSAETIAIMLDHEGVRERVQPTHPHISSFNFTKDVFFDASWDDVVVKARGFFVNKQSCEIVARGYDKFFNVGERSETSIKAISTNFVFPLVGYVKENGYLGNIGYDRVTDDLFVATKSSASGDFSTWFRAILDQEMSKIKQEALARWLRDNQACLTFEVIDPVNDPHMIDYPAPKLILLDVFRRGERAERLSYEQAKIFASKFGFDIKKRAFVFPNASSFEGWYNKVSQDLTYTLSGQDVEGVVFEDAQGKMTKVKFANYAFWKKMRTKKDTMARAWKKMLDEGLAKNAKLDAYPNSRSPRFDPAAALEQFQEQWRHTGRNIHPAAAAFLSWCAGQDPQMWQQSIIELKRAFLATNPDPSIWSVPFSQQPQPDTPSKKVTP